VTGASGLVSVGGIDELGNDVPNNDVTVMKENCEFCGNTEADAPADVD
jgi:hypothetical protein